MKSFLDRTPLRVKLVAAVLALVTAALVLTGLASALAMRRYLEGRIDEQIHNLSDTIDVNAILLQRRAQVLPTNYLVAAAPIGGSGPLQHDPHLSDDELPPLPTTSADIDRHAGTLYTVKALKGPRRWRLLVTVKPSGQVLVVGELMTDVDEAVRRLVIIDVIMGGGVLLVLAALGVTLVRASLRPLVEIERTAGRIATGQLGQRVPESDPGTEVGQLARSLNAMLTQIEQAFAARAASELAARGAERAAHEAAAAAQASESRARRSEERMRQFIADASHELRTPLTTIRGFAELYRQGAVEPANTAGLLRRIEDEAARMGLLVEDLLLLARLDQERPLVLAPVELRILAADAVAAARAVDPDRPISLDTGDGGRAVLVLGDEPRLRQVIGNLVTNALTHTPAGTPVTVRLAVDGTFAVLEVVDAGPGIAAEQADRVFQRFYRVDKARTRQAARADSQAQAGGHSGAGLGLAIVAGLVAAHSGTVEVETEPGRGATFRVRLPLLERPDEAEIDDSPLPETSQPDPSSGEASAGIV